MFYLDSVATTPVKQEVYEAMIPWLTSNYGNPSSKYRLGYQAKKAVEDSREVVANRLGALPEEIFFTSCGSEANTWALRGIKKNFKCRKSGNAVISPIEHHSVLNALPKAQHFDVDMFGRINMDDLKSKIKDDTYMVSCMFVNNEIGTIMDIESIAQICDDKGIFFHVDAVQALGHIPIDLSAPEMKGITSLSISGHKIGAPKGIGALYIKKDVQEMYHPLIAGGQQERGLRGGTENVPYIVGLAKACELAAPNPKDYLRIKGMNIYAWDFLKDNISNVHLNGLPLLDKNHIANILNVSIDDVNGEDLVEFLNEQGYCISTGSACNSDSAEPSHVIKALGHSDDRANSSIRISLSNETKLVEVNALCQKIVEDVAILRGET